MSDYQRTTGKSYRPVGSCPKCGVTEIDNGKCVTCGAAVNKTTASLRTTPLTLGERERAGGPGNGR